MTAAAEHPDPLSFARALVGAGVPVFACPPGGTAEGFKLPVGWERITADPRRLDVWRPGYALAALCGSHAGPNGAGQGVDVIDLDPRNGGTWDTLRGALGDAVELPPVLAMVGTPSGGVHLYVAAQGLGKGKLCQGVDYQAGTGVVEGGRTDRGFVWIPPTVRVPKTGPSAGRPAGYVMAGGFDPEGGAQSESFKRWVTEARARPASPAGDKEVLSGPVLRGGRDNDATSYAASLRRRGFTRAEAEGALEARWATYEQPAGDRYELGDAMAKLDSAWARFEAREEPLDTQGFSVRPALQLVAPLAPGAEQAGLPGFVVPEVKRYEFVDWHALATQPEPTVEWLVPGILAAGRGHLVYSATGQGKSLLALEWVAGLARAGRRLLYCDWENNPRGDVWARLLAMGYAAAELDSLRYLSFPRLAPLDTAAGVELVNLALAEGVEHVVLDTASRTIQGEENSNDTWAGWDRHTGVPLRREGVGFTRLDHAGKDVERGARGGSAKGSDVDIVWRLESEETRKGIVVTITNEKDRVQVPSKMISFRRMGEPLRHERIAEDPQTAGLQRNSERLTEIWERLDSLTVPEKSGFEVAAAALRGSGWKGDDKLVKAVVAIRKAQGNDFYVYPDWAPERYRPGVPDDGWAVGGEAPC